MEELSNLTNLEILYSCIENEGLKVLSEYPFVSDLTHLNISKNDITVEGIKSHMGKLNNLISLDISYNRIYHEGLEALAAQPFASQLKQLNIGASGIPAIGLEDYMSKFISLISLDIGSNDICDEGLKAISAQPFAPQLTYLNIRSSYITAEGIKAMGTFASLINLDISCNYRVEDEGLELLAHQPFASKLTHLNLSYNFITAEGIKAHMGKFASLTNLDISYNEIGKQELKALSVQPFASKLTKLTITSTSIADREIQAYRNKFTNLKL